MKTVVFVFHPNLKESRVNKKLSESLSEENNVVVRNIYDIYLNGEIDVQAEQAIMEQADRIVLQFPFYWYSSPSLLKQWEDAVLQYGWAFGANGDKLHGKELLIVTTTGATGYSRTESVKYTVEELLRPFQATSNLIGTSYLKPYIVSNSMAIDENIIDQIAKDYKNYILNPNIALLDMYA